MPTAPPTAEQVLAVLNGLATVDLSRLEFAVITRKPLPSRDPFALGEVLVVDRFEHREPWFTSLGRKPGKWDVDYEFVPTLEEAMALRQRVLAEARSL